MSAAPSFPPRPVPGALRPTALAPRRREVLASGMRTALVQSGSVPVVALRLVVEAGSAHLAAGQTWLDRLLHDFLREGSATHDRAAFADALAAMGGHLDIDGDEHTTVLRAQVLAEYAADAAALLIGLARAPRIPEAETARLVADQQRSAQIALQEPQWRAHATFRAALYGRHPYATVLPDAEALAGLTAQDARAFWERHSGAGRATLMAAGKFDAGAVLDAAARASDGWATPEAIPVQPAQVNQRRTVRFVSRPGSEQTTLRVGLPVPPPGHGDYIALEVANALLGGSFNSRITQNIRERKGYTYSPSSQISTRPRDAYWVESADVTTAVTADALGEILGEVDRLRASAPPAEEVASVSSYVAGVFAIRGATLSGLLDHLEFLALHGLDDGYTAAYEARVRSVTPAEVWRVARDYLRPERLTIVAVGDPEVARPGLGRFGLVSEG
ncbi:MAG: insulinase family protein [Dehalococcoidia bacterium]|nr:MAG: insulinase family protein [Dehalococcoidia bacterium]